MTPDRPTVARALADASPVPFWWDDPDRPDPVEMLAHDTEAELAVVGGGYLGLWTALLAKERDPDAEVLVCEAHRCGHAASGRNGGFCEASLTHGFSNGLTRWPDELPELLALGRANLDAIEDTVGRLGIECDFRRTGTLGVATEPHQVDWLAQDHAAMEEYGVGAKLLDRDAVRALVDSPTYLGAVHEPDCALVEPARLAWGLRRACLDAGVRIHEHTPVSGITRDGDELRLRVGKSSVRARKVVLATNAYRPLLRRLRLMTVPVYDYALVTEPLSTAQRESIGWQGGEGVSDSGNQFHYYRPVRGDRILFGGYDAIYHYGSAMHDRLEQRPATFRRLAANFLTTFPQLEGIGFSHAWGGVIDTCTRFTAFYGTALQGRVAYALGFTGLGVGATRFAGEVVLDLLAGEETERTRLRMVQERPLPFPPEPLRSAGVNATRWSLARQDANGGRPNLWLRAMDRLGFGFDS